LTVLGLTLYWARLPLLVALVAAVAVLAWVALSETRRKG
jgi:hypothetical protein